MLRLKVVLFFLFFGAQLLCASSISTQEFIKCIKSGNSKKVEAFFLDLERQPPTLAESRQFLYELSHHLSNNYNIPIDKFSIVNADKRIKKLQLLSNFSVLRVAPIDAYVIWSKDLLLSLEKQYLSNDLVDREPPADFVIGLVEMFAGSLMCVLPYSATQKVGITVIMHGFYKVIGALPEIEKMNELVP